MTASRGRKSFEYQPIAGLRLFIQKKSSAVEAIARKGAPDIALRVLGVNSTVGFIGSNKVKGIS